MIAPPVAAVRHSVQFGMIARIKADLRIADGPLSTLALRATSFAGASVVETADSPPGLSKFLGRIFQ
jgi:hypothetical protein